MSAISRMVLGVVAAFCRPVPPIARASAEATNTNDMSPSADTANPQARSVTLVTEIQAYEVRPMRLLPTRTVIHRKEWTE